MSAPRLERLLLCVPVLWLVWSCFADVWWAGAHSSPASRQWRRTSSNQQEKWIKVAYHAFLAAFEYCVRGAGVARLAGAILLSVLFGMFWWVEERNPNGTNRHRHQRRGAEAGITIGATIAPLLFATHLYMYGGVDGISSESTRLFWLSLCCSTVALVAALTGEEGVASVDGPGLTELFTTMIMAQTALAVQDSLMAADTLLVCLLFSYTLYFLLHVLRFSFTSGEAVLVSTLLSLLGTHAFFSLLSHSLRFYIDHVRGGSVTWMIGVIQDWCERAHILDVSFGKVADVETRTEARIQSDAFYNALIVLHVGVILLGFIWFPFAIQWKRARTRRLRQERRSREHDSLDVKVELEEREKQQKRLESVTDEHTPSEGGKLKRRKILAVSGLMDDTSTSSSSQSQVAQQASSSSSSSSASKALGRTKFTPQVSTPPPPLRCSFSAPFVWFLLCVSIFGVLWPYIALEMGQEPFQFIWRFLVSIPESDASFLAKRLAQRQRGEYVDEDLLPPSLMFSALHGGSTVEIGGMELDYSIFAQSMRMTIIGFWCASMVIGIMLFAPAGRAIEADAAGREKQSELIDSDANQVSESDHAPSTASVSSPRRVDITPSAPNSPVTIESSSSRPRARCGLSPRSWPNILIRKWYHFLAVWMFIPAILLEPGFVALSLAVASAIFVLVEYIRISRLAPIGVRIHAFMKSYLDVRDSGLVILTHAYLLLGCALPLWFHLHVLASDDPSILAPSFQSSLAFMSGLHEARAYAGAESHARSRFDRYGSPTAQQDRAAITWDMSHYIPAMAGVLILGIGDSMASLVGVWIGRIKWPGTNRTVEGTIAGALSVIGFTYALLYGMGLINDYLFNGVLVILPPRMFGFSLATILTCLLEAFTSQIDNLFLPIFYYVTMLLIGV